MLGQREEIASALGHQGCLPWERALELGLEGAALPSPSYQGRKSVPGGSIVRIKAERQKLRCILGWRAPPLTSYIPYLQSLSLSSEGMTASLQGPWEGRMQWYTSAWQNVSRLAGVAAAVIAGAQAATGGCEPRGQR